MIPFHLAVKFLNFATMSFITLEGLSSPVTSKPARSNEWILTQKYAGVNCDRQNFQGYSRFKLQ